MDVIEELKFLGKITKKWGGVRVGVGSGGRVGGGGVGWGGGGQGGCDRRIEVFWKIHKKNWRGVGGGLSRGGGWSGCWGSGWM